MSDELFSKDNIPKSNWFTMEKVGDRVSGTVVEMYETEATPDFPAQRVFGLKQEDESVINFGIKLFKKDKVSPSYLNTRTKSVQPGDIVGFEFVKEIPPTTKGYHPAKSIEVYVRKGVKPAQNLDDLN